MHTYYYGYIVLLLDIICKLFLNVSIINLGNLIQFFRGMRLYLIPFLNTTYFYRDTYYI